MSDYAELQCATCEEVVAHVQLIPGLCLVHGDVYCDNCFDPDIGEVGE